MLQKSLSLIESIVNEVLSQDPHVQSQLGEHAGCIVRVDVEDLGISLDIIPSEHGILLTQASLNPADVRLTGSAPALLKLLKKSQSRGKSRFKELKLEGDFELALSLSRAMSELQIDWETLLTKPLGRSLAHETVQFGQKSLAFAKRLVNKLGRDVRHSLQSGWEVCPHAKAVDDFCQEVDELRMAVDRLDSKIKRQHKKGES